MNAPPPPAAMPIDPARLPMWVVYSRPLDFPEHFVARMHYSLPSPEPTSLVMLSPNLEALQLYFSAAGFTRLERDPADDPFILETWLV